MALSLLAGIRTEEARALRWDHVVTWADDAAGWQPVTTAGLDCDGGGEGLFAIYVWRAQRHGGDTKTDKSRRTLALPGAASGRFGSIASSRPGTGCEPESCGRTTA